MFSRILLHQPHDGAAWTLVLPVQRSSHAVRSALVQALREADIPAGTAVQGRATLEVLIVQEPVRAPVTEASCRAAVEDSMMFVFVFPCETGGVTCEDTAALGALPGIGGRIQSERTETALVTPAELAQVMQAAPRSVECWMAHDGLAYLHAEMGRAHGFDATGSRAAVATMPTGAEILKAIGPEAGHGRATRGTATPRPEAG